MKPALLALLIALTQTPSAASGQIVASSLSARNQTRASALILRLETFDESIKGQDRSSVSGAERFLAEVYKGLQGFPENNVKTDIATAAYFYRLAANKPSARVSEPRTFSCASERPGTYRTLCVENAGSQRELLLAKARLHTTWAKAVLRNDHNSTMLGDVANQRRDDEFLAARAVAALRRLQNQVLPYASLSDFEEKGLVARVPLVEFRKSLFEAEGDIAKTLAWLPQNRVRVEITNAMLCYYDGVFWWNRVYQPRAVNVSALAGSEPQSPADRALLTRASYTVVINWRQAAEHTNQAESLLNSNRKIVSAKDTVN